MADTDFDLFVVGGGSGGVRAARMTANLGYRVGLAEESRMGGTCVIRGCIPKKLFVYASRFAEDFELAPSFGWTLGEPSFAWPTLRAGKDKEIARLEGLYTQAVEQAGGVVFRERAVLLDAHRLRLAIGREITADKILVATGGHAVRAVEGIAGLEHCITSNEAFDLERLPRRMVIAGGGYIAVEFAHIFHGLGVDTTLLYRGPKVLRGFDDDLRDALHASMARRGLRVLTHDVFTAIEKHDGGLIAHTYKGERLEADAVMLAIGRRPNSAGLGLENAGVATGPHGRIEVDAYSRTTAENIYAVGDVTDRLALTPVAIHEAMCFVKTVFENTPTRPDHALVPTAVFSTPEIGTVGLSEAGALELGHAIDVYKSNFRPLRDTLLGEGDRTMMKLVVAAADDRLLGAHLFGPDAAEMAQLLAVAMKMGARKSDLDSTIALHPSAAEELVTMRTKAYSRP
jgi:glutathione reductase (NADPH)